MTKLHNKHTRSYGARALHNDTTLYARRVITLLCVYNQKLPTNALVEAQWTDAFFQMWCHWRQWRVWTRRAEEPRKVPQRVKRGCSPSIKHTQTLHGYTHHTHTHTHITSLPLAFKAAFRASRALHGCPERGVAEKLASYLGCRWSSSTVSLEDAVVALSSDGWDPMLSSRFRGKCCLSARSPLSSCARAFL